MWSSKARCRPIHADTAQDPPGAWGPQSRRARAQTLFPEEPQRKGQQPRPQDATRGCVQGRGTHSEQTDTEAQSVAVSLLEVRKTGHSHQHRLVERSRTARFPQTTQRCYWGGSGEPGPARAPSEDLGAHALLTAERVSGHGHRPPRQSRLRTLLTTFQQSDS